MKITYRESIIFCSKHFLKIAGSLERQRGLNTTAFYSTFQRFVLPILCELKNLLNNFKSKTIFLYVLMADHFNIP